MVKNISRVLLLILDGVGCGELPDAKEYNDEGSNTLGNLSEKLGGLNLPNFELLGLGNIIPIKGVKSIAKPLASYGKCAELSNGKDSMTGHWELMGVIVNKPFPVYPNGFTKEMIEKFEKSIGRKVIGGFPASGTEIIKQLGELHIKTGYPIIYTSADSVFQIACHKDIIPLDELYRMCEIARNLFPDIGRIIARPFIGKPGNFVRTHERKDYSLQPKEKTLLDLLSERNIKTITIGKIDYLFGGRGINKIIHTKNNKDAMNKIIETIKNEYGFIFANLVDFDMLWGHRNDAEGFAKGLKEVDDWLPTLLDNLKETDVLFITADHGVDPTTPSTDHSREYVPLLVYGKDIKCGINLGIRKTYADIGATIGEIFNVKTKYGNSFFSEIIK